MIPCQTVGWPLFALQGEESPGSTEARCRVTPGGGDPRESATENIPPSPSAPTLPLPRKRGRVREGAAGGKGEMVR